MNSNLYLDVENILDQIIFLWINMMNYIKTLPNNKLSCFLPDKPYLIKYCILFIVIILFAKCHLGFTSICIDTGVIFVMFWYQCYTKFIKQWEAFLFLCCRSI